MGVWNLDDIKLNVIITTIFAFPIKTNFKYVIDKKGDEVDKPDSREDGKEISGMETFVFI